MYSFARKLEIIQNMQMIGINVSFSNDMLQCFTKNGGFFVYKQTILFVERSDI